MDCPFCKDKIQAFDGPRRSHLVMGKMLPDGHIHIHGDLDDKASMKEFLEVAAEECGVTPGAQGTVPAEVVFHNRQRIGDILVMTCAIRDYKAAFPKSRVNVITTAAHIWDYNPHIDRTLAPTEANTRKIGPSRLTNSSNRLDWHFCNAYRVSIEDELKIHIAQGESRPDIWLHQSEYDSPRPFAQPYWVICITGEKGWGCKMYPADRWQQFVKDNPNTLFVQIGAMEDHPPRLQGANVIDWVGKTQSKESGIRDLYKLFLHAEGSIGLVSFHMHLSGGLYKPAIVIAGAREPVSFTRYAGHQYLATDGCLPCATQACWHCDINTCTNLIDRPETAERRIPKCVDIIDPDMISQALRQYYRGGRLRYDVPADRPKLRNISRGPVMVAIPQAPKVEEGMPDISRFPGFTWGGGSLTHKDWAFMKEAIEKYQVKSVLEFGAGLSTLLLNELGLDVTTLETSEGWIKKVKEINPKADVLLWPGKYEFEKSQISQALDQYGINVSKKIDMIFVDGPAGGRSREWSTAIGAHLAKVLIIHDAGREPERAWQDKYVKGVFSGPVKGGHRCHLWLREASLSPQVAIIEPSLSPQRLFIDPSASDAPMCPARDRSNHELGKAIDFPGIVEGSRKFVKIVSTARGWGGCARSVTTILDQLMKAGHQVEFVPFRNSVTSREYGQWLKEHPQVRVSLDYGAVAEACDALLVYADDYVWEFGSAEMQHVFEHIQADRKVMMINYRNGNVGTIPWTKHWHQYIFLNSTQEQELLKRHAGANTRVLPPCTILEPFFHVKPDYDNGVRVVRHSSQGDTKFPKDIQTVIDSILSVTEHTQFAFLPGATFMEQSQRCRRVGRTADPEVIAEFLATGNLFWYSLPEGYMDMGPRVILEAMAAGLSILADPWGGALDRVNQRCGWLVNKQEQAFIIQTATANELRRMGEAARAFAHDNFIPQRWVEAIIG